MVSIVCGLAGNVAMLVAMSSSGHRVVVMSSQPRRHMVATLSLFRPHICHRAVVTTRFEIQRLSTNCMPHSVPFVFFKKKKKCHKKMVSQKKSM